MSDILSTSDVAKVENLLRDLGYTVQYLHNPDCDYGILIGMQPGSKSYHELPSKGDHRVAELMDCLRGYEFSPEVFWFEDHLVVPNAKVPSEVAIERASGIRNSHERQF
jgi:hypothetical protein